MAARKKVKKINISKKPVFMPIKRKRTFLFSYVSKENAKHAKTKGKELSGSYSAYINDLISLDRKGKLNGQRKNVPSKSRTPISKNA